jgi:hypothetical protein
VRAQRVIMLQTNKSIIIGAVIIGISLIVALNFGKFVEWAEDATYQLSGQAAADKRASEQNYANGKAQEAIAEQERAEQNAQFERKNAARIEATRALVTAWQDYLTANRPRFKQIDVIRDTEKGDYICLRIIYGNAASRSAEFSSNEADKRTREQMFSLWTYELRDRIADGFVQWLNGNKVLKKTDWQYDDLKHLDSQYSSIENCLFPSQVWRANRYQRRIE